MAFRPFDREYYHRMFPRGSSSHRLRKPRRHFRRPWLSNSGNPTITPQAPHLKISPRRQTVTSDGPRLRPHLTNLPRPHPIPNLPSSALAPNLLFRPLRNPLLPHSCHVGFTTLHHHLGHKTPSPGKQRRQNRKGGFKTCPLVYDGVCSISS